MRHARSLVWLGAGALLMGAEAHTPALFLAPWIALTLVLRATRRMAPWPGLAYVFLALYAALAAGNRGILPMGGPVYFAVLVPISLVAVLPFAALAILNSMILSRGSNGFSSLKPIERIAISMSSSSAAPSDQFCFRR